MVVSGPAAEKEHYHGRLGGYSPAAVERLLRRVEVALSMKLISNNYSQQPGSRKRSHRAGGPQSSQHCARWAPEGAAPAMFARCGAGFRCHGSAIVCLG
jgi:hypothetical protein